MKRKAKRHVYGAALICALMVLCGMANGAPRDTVEIEKGPTCNICHGKVAKIHAGSVHARFEEKCVSCHGGDDTKTDKYGAMSPDKGFRGSFTPREVLDLCTSCHADFGKMRQFGIPVDQLQQYKTSRHGIALLQKGNKKAAVCINCHGVHNILEVKNPEASVYPTNVPDTCGKCHADKKYMAPFGVPTNVVSEYKKGVHGKRLAKLDTAAPTCTTCHGNHGAAPPGVVEVVNICGKCHTNIRDEFKQSKHFRKGLECINCHDNHNNTHPTTAKFTEHSKRGCRSCHDKHNSKAVAYINATLKSLDRAGRDLKKAEGMAASAASKGFYVDSEKVLLQEGQTALIEFRNTQHTLKHDAIMTQLTTVSSKAEHVMEKIDVKYASITDRRIIMGGVVAYLLFLLILIYIKFTRLRRAYLKSRAEGHV